MKNLKQKLANVIRVLLVVAFTLNIYMEYRVITMDTQDLITRYSSAAPFQGSAPFKVKNLAARLITLNVVDDETGDKLAFGIYPAHEATPVPASAVNNDFARTLVVNGDLAIYGNA